MGNGRHGETAVAPVMVASRMVESCGMDATGKRERRPKSKILINRTPGEIGGGVQNHLVLGIGRY